jgi:hypothetical protein
MPRALPSLAALFLTISPGPLSLAMIPGCAHQAPVAPGPPLPAAVEVVVGTMDVECDALIAAFDRWRRCPNADDEGRELIDFWKKEAELDFAAGKKATIEPEAQKAIAVRCRKATNSVTAAIERCGNGPRPKD